MGYSLSLLGWNLQFCNGQLLLGACVSFDFEVTFSLSIISGSPCFRLRAGLCYGILSFVRNKNLGFKTELISDLACPVYDQNGLVGF